MSTNETIVLKHEKLEEIPEIDESTKYLIIYRNKIKKITLPISLVELDISDNMIKEIENLDLCTNIEILDLSFNLITEIKNLQNNTKLKELYLISNDIEKIENLSQLVNLKKLDIASNGISKIENLCIGLEELFLANNEIVDVENLEELKCLTVLGLRNNCIKSLDCSKLPKTIKHLVLSENKDLREIINLDLLVNLEYLEVANTMITELHVKDGIEIIYK